MALPQQRDSGHSSHLVFVEVGVDPEQALVHLVTGLGVGDLQGTKCHTSVTQVWFYTPTAKSPSFHGHEGAAQIPSALLAAGDLLSPALSSLPPTSLVCRNNNSWDFQNGSETLHPQALTVNTQGQGTLLAAAVTSVALPAARPLCHLRRCRNHTGRGARLGVRKPL